MLSNQLHSTQRFRYGLSFCHQGGALHFTMHHKNAYKWDKKFWVTKKCTGCGLCVKVCPVKNIEMKNRLPFWQHNCEKCLACIHWCPNAAIEYGKNTIERTRYRNPNIKAEDIINSLEVWNE